MTDRRTPLDLVDERQTLVQFLDYLRESVAIKAGGLDEASARRSTVPSGTSLLGLIKHLTSVEMLWFQYAFAGLDVDLPSDDVTPADTVESALAVYRGSWQMSNAIVADCSDLNQLCQRSLTTPEPLSPLAPGPHGRGDRPPRRSRRHHP